MRSAQLIVLVAMLAGCGDEVPVFYYASADTAAGDASGEDAAESDTLDDTAQPDTDDAEEVGLDGISDVAPDTAPDAEPDTTPDTSPDAAPDATPDTAPDAEPDVAPDVIRDTEPDAEFDVPDDCTPVAAVRAGSLGLIEGTFCEVVVTYISPFGFFVQEQSLTGPAINVFEDAAGWANPEGIEVGDVLTFDVYQLGEYRGMEQITSRSPAILERRGYGLGLITQTLDDGAGVPPSESNESELVTISDGRITAILGRDLTVEYGGIETTLRVGDAGPLCLGLEFSMTGVVTENEDEGIHRIESWWPADFSFDPDDCVSDLPLASRGDLVLNEVLADPPDEGGDANCDGERVADEDEYVEVVNVSDRDLSLAGITISDTVSVRHTFGSLAEIRAGEAVLIFGGGSPDCDFSGTPAEVASTGALGLSNAGDTISLSSPTGIAMEEMTYTTSMSTDVSVVLSPEANTSGTYARHSVVAPDMSAYSAGVRTDGTPF